MRRSVCRRHQIKAAKAPGIIERHHPAIAGFEHDMIMFFKGFRIHPHPPRHAEMDNQRIAAIGLHQAIFGAPVQPGDEEYAIIRNNLGEHTLALECRWN